MVANYVYNLNLPFILLIIVYSVKILDKITCTRDQQCISVFKRLSDVGRGPAFAG